MSGVVYPSGTQILAIPTTTLHPSTSSPFNPSIINVPNEVNWNAIKALEAYGFFNINFDAAQPPYPAPGAFVNAGGYRLLGSIQFTNTAGGALSFSTDYHYARSASLVAHYDITKWSFLYGAPINAKYKNTSGDSANPVTFGFELPDNITLEEVVVRIEPAGAHVNLPAVKPRVYVWMTDNSLGTTTLLTAAVSDAPANVAAYETPHNIVVTLPSTAFGAWKNSVVVEVYGESGANALVDLVTCLPILKFDRSGIGEEFGEQLP